MIESRTIRRTHPTVYEDELPENTYEKNLRGIEDLQLPPSLEAIACANKQGWIRKLTFRDGRVEICVHDVHMTQARATGMQILRAASHMQMESTVH